MLFWEMSSILPQSSALTETVTVVAKIDKLMQYSYENGIFNGALLISQKDKNY
jgi:hypothetical protein